ncbi:MAG: hypothetical protein JMM79_02320 [Candidatus Xiphinematobacter sp.]|nr:MAG: hypothetical protein JMM79_02320 [Candidatus Xiphinematobacter sp.]
MREKIGPYRACSVKFQEDFWKLLAIKLVFLGDSLGGFFGLVVVSLKTITVGGRDLEEVGSIYAERELEATVPWCSLSGVELGPL